MQSFVQFSKETENVFSISLSYSLLENSIYAVIIFKLYFSFWGENVKSQLLLDPSFEHHIFLNTLFKFCFQDLYNLEEFPEIFFLL